MAPDSVWEIVFLMVILKIPVVYLCVIVYYAIRAKPKPEAGASVTASLGPGDGGPGGWRRPRRRGLRPRPHGGPARTYARAPRSGHAVARARRA